VALSTKGIWELETEGPRESPVTKTTRASTDGVLPACFGAHDVLREWRYAGSVDRLGLGMTHGPSHPFQNRKKYAMISRETDRMQKAPSSSNRTYSCNTSGYFVIGCMSKVVVSVVYCLITARPFQTEVSD
jgi:hypothetical protein